MWRVVLLLFGFVRCSTGSSGHKLGYVLTVNSSGDQLDHFCATVLGPSGALQPTGWTPLVNWLHGIPSEPSFIHPSGSLGIAILLRSEDVPIVMRNYDRALCILAPGESATLSRIPRSAFNDRFLLIELGRTNFNQLNSLWSNSSKVDAVVDLNEDSLPPIPSVLNLAVVFTHLCAFTSILLGCGMVLLSWDTLIAQLQSREATLKGSKLCVFAGVGLFMIFCCACLLLYYFFYDIAVYIAIAVYFVLGTIAISHVLSFWVKQFCNNARKTIVVDFQLWRWSVHRDLLLVKLYFLPIGLAIMITWVYFRNDFRIGWPMQSVIGIIFVAWLLSLNVPCPSLKLISVIFTLFVFYDVFFVFITPYFVSHQRHTNEPSLVAESRTLRYRRSAEGYMEAIATGSAGKSGESLPASFRFRIVLPSGVFGCSTQEYGMLLGYGDAVFPGFLSAYLALFDSVWKIRFRRNFVASLFGYLLGTVATHLAMSLMQRGQPALLYLCPFTLLSTVLGCLIFGGTEELRRLWAGCLTSSQTTEFIDFRGDGAMSNTPDASVASVNLDEVGSRTTLKPVV